MAEELGQGQTVRSIHWREAFPFTHLFRGFRVAIHPSKLVLALLLLLLVYVGGRILDSLWNERDLAVPNEVSQYEAAWESGAARGDFARERREQRQRIERDYADRLVALDIEKDPAKARAMAVDGDGLGRMKERIVADRDKARAAADKQYGEDVAAAQKISNDDDRERALAAAREIRDRNVRVLYRQAYADLKQAKLIDGVGIFHAFFEYETNQIARVASGVITWNWLGGWRDDPGPQGIITSLRNFLIVGPLWLMQHHPLYFILFSLLFLTIWAIFGGAIARIAAVHVARDEKLSVRAALQFSIGKFLSFFSAPLIPLIIVLVVGLVPYIAGLLASIPYVGPVVNIIMGLLFVLLLACGFIMTLVLFGTLGGLNLMYPTIAVEGSDSFDAISRSFSYVYARPWRMLFYTLVAIVYGALTYLFVRLFVGVMLALTHTFIGAGMYKDAPSHESLWNVMWPGGLSRLAYDVDFLTLRWDQDTAAALIAFWVYLTIALTGAYVISYFFSANSIIYYLMRREVDATEMDDVFLEQADEDFGEGAPVTAPVEQAPIGGSATDTATAGEPTPGTVAAPPVTGVPADSPAAPPPATGAEGSSDAGPSEPQH